MRYVVPAVASLALIGAAVWLLVDPVLALYVIGLVIGIYLVVGSSSSAL